MQHRLALRRCPGRLPGLVGLGLLAFACSYIDANMIEPFLFDEVVLDRTAPAYSFAIEVCSSEPELEVSVSAREVGVFSGAILGVEIVQGERRASAFLEGGDDRNYLSETLYDVACDEPIYVTFERLDGALVGQVGFEIRVGADAEGIDGTTDVRVLE